MDHCPYAIEQRRSPVGRGRAPATPGRRSRNGGTASWGALLTSTCCARDGTPDGRPGRVGARWTTPSEAMAWRDAPGAKGRSGNRRRGVLAQCLVRARPPAEEGA